MLSTLLKSHRRERQDTRIRKTQKTLRRALKTEAKSETDLWGKTIV